MESINAEDVLEKINISSYPNMSKESRKRIDKHYQKAFRNNRESDLKTLTPQELAYGIARKQIDGK